jgi:hypothetical protein
MRLSRLYRRFNSRRLTIHRGMPWPLRWALIAVVLGFCAAIALWAFDLGKNLSGLQTVHPEEVSQLRTELEKVRFERDRAQSIANVSESLLTTAKATQEQLVLQINQLETENRSLRDDLGFFEKLIPTNLSENIAIRGVQVERVSANQLKWQVLVIQSQKNAPVFQGSLELIFNGSLNGKTWNASPAGGKQALTLKEYRRVEGFLNAPEAVKLKTVTVKITEGQSVKAIRTVKIS